MSQLEHYNPETEERALAVLEKRSKLLASSELVPTPLRGKPNDIAAIWLTADALGLPPTLATLTQFHVIEGRATPSAQLMMALAARHGHAMWFVRTTDTIAEVAIQRRGQDHVSLFSFTLEQAGRAGLLDEWVERKYREQGDRYDRREKFILDREGVDEPEWATKERRAGRVKRKENWHLYRESMLMARAVTRAVRAVCPDVLLGLPAQDEHETVETAPASVQVAVAEARQRMADATTDDDIAEAELVEDVPPEAHDDSPDAHEYPERPDPPREASVAAGRRPAAAEQDPTPREPEAGGDGPAPVAAAPVEDYTQSSTPYSAAVHVLASRLHVSDEALDEILFEICGDVSAKAVTRENSQRVVARIREVAGIEAA